MSDVKITVNLNESLKVEGEVTFLDHAGEEIPMAAGRPFWMCRCGASRNEPFCDGSHRRTGLEGSRRHSRIKHGPGPRRPRTVTSGLDAVMARGPSPA